MKRRAFSLLLALCLVLSLLPGTVLAAPSSAESEETFLHVDAAMSVQEKT